jgi:hypothetical protein
MKSKTGTDKEKMVSLIEESQGYLSFIREEVKN